jgi:hypothetical protein
VTNHEKLKWTKTADSLTLSGTLSEEQVEETAMSILVDCGASKDFIDRNFIVSKNLSQLMQPLTVPIHLQTIDGETTAENDITDTITLPIYVGKHKFTETFLVTKLAPEHPVVFGLTWFKRYDPDIHWPSHTVLKYRKEEPEQRDTTASVAFAAGGVISEPSTDSQQAESQLNHLCMLRGATARALASKARPNTKTGPLTLNAFAVTINGLTKNDDNWMESIPKRHRRFANSVFSDDSAAKLPPHRGEMDCSIEVKQGETLSTCKIYDMSKEQLDTLKAILDEQLKKGFIRPSTSSNSSPVFFVTNDKTQRLVIDYRSLNSKIKLNEYPIPLSRTVMERLPTAKIFTKFDVRAGFYNLRMREGDERYTAFKTFFGLFEFNVMPMGLATAPSVFQRFINSVLAPYLDIFCFAYLDDIIIFSENEEEHDRHVTLILEALEKNDLHLKPSKCVWSVTEIDFLGFTAVAGKGIRMSDDKLQALREWKRPETVKEVRMFLGTINFCSKMMPHFSDNAAPLNELTKKGKVFSWTPECEASWNRMMGYLRSDQFVTAFQPELPIVLETDASDVAYAGRISQRHPDGSQRTVLLFSHKFKDEESRWTVAEKELFAIVYALRRYPYFLTNKLPLEVYSDHRNLARFMLTTKLTGRLGRWYDEIIQCGINFQIQYRPGAENTIADALSRYGLDSHDDEPAYDSILPRHRFSAKALADLDSLRTFENSSPRPHTLETPPHAPRTITHSESLVKKNRANLAFSEKQDFVGSTADLNSTKSDPAVPGNSNDSP